MHRAVCSLAYDDTKEKFKNYTAKFVVLIVDEKTILQRDKKRPIDFQMHERCLILLNDFKNTNYKKDYFLDTTNLSIDETIDIIENTNKFLI